jgi:hypothetical protein
LFDRPKPTAGCSANGEEEEDVNILGRSLHTVKKNAKALVAASKETGLEVNADKANYMVMS